MSSIFYNLFLLSPSDSDFQRYVVIKLSTAWFQLLESESYGERRGAAFGLAGLVKGLGILSLKQHSIITALNDAIQNKKIWRYREGLPFLFGYDNNCIRQTNAKCTFFFGRNLTVPISYYKKGAIVVVVLITAVNFTVKN